MLQKCYQFDTQQQIAKIVLVDNFNNDSIYKK
jgi:hypothetical protein